MLNVRDLQVQRRRQGDPEGLDLAVKAGEVHAIMGPNGSGKRTLSKVMAGHPAYKVTAAGHVLRRQGLLDLGA